MRLRRATTSPSSPSPWPSSASARPEPSPQPRPAWPAPRPTAAIGWAGALFALTAVAAYVTADRIPLDTYRIGADASQLAWLALFFIVAAVPFTCAGVAVVAALRHSPSGAGTTYGASLAGSAAGSALAVPLLGLVGSAATILLAAALAMAAPLLLASRLQATIAGLLGLGPHRRSHRRRPRRTARLRPLPTRPGPPTTRRPPPRHPALLQLPRRHPPERRLPHRHRLEPQLHGIRPAPPPWPDRRRRQRRRPRHFACRSPRPRPPCPRHHHAARRTSALLLDPIGAFDAAVLLRAGSRRNRPRPTRRRPPPGLAIRRRRHGPERLAASASSTSGVRSALRSATGYDLVVWPLRESFQGVAAGTFGLRETYALTRDALADGWRALAPNGRLVVTRWLQATPSESVRMWASLLAALRQSGITNPAPHLLAWRSLEVVTMLASPTPFTGDRTPGPNDQPGARRLRLGIPRQPRRSRFQPLQSPARHPALPSLPGRRPLVNRPRQPGRPSPTTAPTSSTTSTGPSGAKSSPPPDAPGNPSAAPDSWSWSPWPRPPPARPCSP